jgi:hypothetical protein
MSADEARSLLEKYPKESQRIALAKDPGTPVAVLLLLLQDNKSLVRMFAQDEFKRRDGLRGAQSDVGRGVATEVIAATEPADDGVPAGWYPDPDGKPCSRFWDGEDWTDRTRPVTGAAPNPSVSVPVAAAVSPSVFGYRRLDGTFHGSLRQIFQLAVQSVQALKWTVVNASDVAQTLTFETKISFGSWSGVTCTLSFTEVEPNVWRVSGSGKQNVRGGQLIALDLGESQSKAQKAIDQMIRTAPPVGT